MEARELRIGNIVQCENEIVTVETIHTNTQFNISRIDARRSSGMLYSYMLDFVDPIPLTEDWLLKLGFVDKDYTMDLKAKRKKLTAEWYSRNVSTGVRSGWYFNKYRHIKYVHQLQNLYFAITGEELKII